MNLSLKGLATVLCLLFITGCLSGKSGIRSPKAAEPFLDKSKYLSATGEGQSNEEAGMRAKAALSAIFEAQVTSEVVSRVSSLTESGMDEKVTRQAEQNVRVLSSVELKGVEIAAHWFDERGGFYHAIAALERKKAARQWRNDMKGIDHKAEAILSSLDEQKSRFGRLRQLRKVRKLWLEKEVIKSRLGVIGAPSSGGGTIEIAKILREISGISAGLLVFVKIDGEFGKVLGDKIAEKLTPEGYTLSEDSGSASLHILGDIKTTPVDLKNPSWEYARASASIAVIDRATGLTLGEITENKRTAHRTYSEAVTRAVREVSSKAAKRVANYIDGTDE